MEVRGKAVLTFNITDFVIDLQFSGTAKIIYIGNVASCAGKFVLDLGGLIARDGDFDLMPKF